MQTMASVINTSHLFKVDVLELVGAMVIVVVEVCGEFLVVRVLL